MKASINPSILSADFVNFEAEFETIVGCDQVHVDVMDNHFVPNLTFGLQMVSSMQRITKRPLDVHLMISDADRFAPDYAKTGAYSVTVHFEACSDPALTAKLLRQNGAKAGLAIKPATALDEILPIIQHFDRLLIMTVEPGFGGQLLIEETLAKVAAARAHFDMKNLAIDLQVDGGITADNIGRVAALGANSFVAGSAVFKASDRNLEINRLRDLATKHSH